MPWGVRVPPWYCGQLPCCDARPEHLEDFLVNVATAVCVLQCGLIGHFNALRRGSLLWGSILMHRIRRAARWLLVAVCAVGASIRCVSCSVYRVSDHALGVPGAPWVLYVKFGSNCPDEGNGHA